MIMRILYSYRLVLIRFDAHEGQENNVGIFKTDLNIYLYLSKKKRTLRVVARYGLIMIMEISTAQIVSECVRTGQSARSHRIRSAVRKMETR